MKKCKEKDLYPQLKKWFKNQGYTVYAEVACFARGVDFVAEKGEDHIAVEMKTSFNVDVVRQAGWNQAAFGKSYVAYPVREVILIPDSFEAMQMDHYAPYRKLKETVKERIEHCRNRGIGILQVVGDSMIPIEVLEARYEKPYRIFDFSQYKESDDDEAGLPCQRGVSAGYYELKAIKEYVTAHPEAKWKEIFDNVQNHYENYKSMAGSMKTWRGFSLADFKKTLN